MLKTLQIEFTLTTIHKMDSVIIGALNGKIYRTHFRNAGYLKHTSEINMSIDMASSGKSSAISL